jgi:hypothetical protein
MDFVDYTNLKGTKAIKKLYVGTERGVILTQDISDLLEIDMFED